MISAFVRPRRFVRRDMSLWTQQAPRNLAIVGGGLAGLSTAYHFLDKCNDTVASLTIWDREAVGQGGASAVAGGYVQRGCGLANWSNTIE